MMVFSSGKVGYLGPGGLVVKLAAVSDKKVATKVPDEELIRDYVLPLSRDGFSGRLNAKGLLLFSMANLRI